MLPLDARLTLACTPPVTPQHCSDICRTRRLQTAGLHPSVSGSVRPHPLHVQQVPTGHYWAQASLRQALIFKNNCQTDLTTPTNLALHRDVISQTSFGLLLITCLVQVTQKVKKRCSLIIYRIWRSVFQFSDILQCIFPHLTDPKTSTNVSKCLNFAVSMRPFPCIIPKRLKVSAHVFSLE